MRIQIFEFVKVIQFLDEVGTKVELNEEGSAPWHHEILSFLTQPRKVSEKKYKKLNWDLTIFLSD